MTATLEDDLRTALHDWADEVRPCEGDPADAMTRSVAEPSRGMRGRPVLWAAAAAAVVALSVGALQLREAPPTGQTGSPASAPGSGSEPSPLSLAAPTVVFTGTEPGWRLVHLRRDRWTSGAHTSFGFVHDDGRQFELNLYPPGDRTPGSALRADEELTVRGQPAFATDEGSPRYRLDWDEAGLQWEVDGEPFSSQADFAATMEGFRVVDRATWDSWLPAELAESLREHRDESVEWREGLPVKILPPSTPMGRGVASMPPQPG
jgi:hypothetical protein